MSSIHRFLAWGRGTFGNRKFAAKALAPRSTGRKKAIPAIELLENRINPSFGNLSTVAQSLRLAENALPQVPGLDTSIGAMLPSRLSDVVGLNAYGSGANTWAGFDQQYPNPTVENLVSIANTVTAGLPTSSSTTNLISGFGNNGTGWTVNNGLGATSSISANTLTFTNGTQGQYNSIWYNSSISNLNNTGWTAEFTLTNVGAQSQDGGSFMLQTAGTAAVGSMYYGSGIANGLSFSWNNYNYPTEGGTQFAVTTGGGTPVFTTNQTAINMSNSSKPLTVVLQYDNFTGNLTATVSQLNANSLAVQSWQQTYNVGNLSALQSGAYVGFVGGNGVACSETTVSNFTFASNLPSMPGTLGATILPTNSGTPTATNALTSSATAPIYGNLPDLQLGQYTSGFTVQAWFNSSDIANTWQRIIDLGNGAASDNIVVGIVDSQLALSTYNGSNEFDFINVGSTLSSNTWYHVTAVFGGGSSGYGAIYLNGVLQGSTSSLQAIPNVARTNNYWGRSNWSADPVWQGQQDELRFWNYQLTAAEIAANYNVALVGPLPSGLIAYYNANENFGSTWHDITGNGNNATAMLNSASGQFTPGMLNPAAFTQTNTLPGQVYINYANAFTSANQPASINTMGLTSGNQITPLLFQVGGTSTVPTYTLVATSSAITPSSTFANSTLNFGYTYTAGAQYVVGYIDQAMTSSGGALSTGLPLNNPSFEDTRIAAGTYQSPYNPTSNWAYSSSAGLWNNDSGLGFPDALDGQQGAWLLGANSTIGTAGSWVDGTPGTGGGGKTYGYLYPLTSGTFNDDTTIGSGVIAFAFAATQSSNSDFSSNGVQVSINAGNPLPSVNFFPSTSWSFFSTPSINLNDPNYQGYVDLNFTGLNADPNALVGVDDIVAGYVGTVPYYATPAGTLSGWYETNTFLGSPQIGDLFGPGASGFGYATTDLGKVYSFGTVGTSTTTTDVPLNPAEFTGNNSSLSTQNGVQIQWALGSSTSPLLYNSVISTGGLDAGLHLTKSGNATLPVNVYGNLSLTLALNSANSVAVGVSGTWNANANLANLNLAAGLGYLDSSISGGSYSMTASGAFNLVDTANNNANASGQVYSSGYVASSSLAPASDFQVPSANSYSTSGLISVQASMPFVGEVGGQPFPTGSSAPTLSLASNTQSWAQGPIGTTTAYIQPQWTLQNFGNYLALAQLDAAALVNTGLNNAGGSLASLNQTNWQQVPFSTSSVAYNWGNGLNGTASLLYQNKLAIAGQTRMQGSLPLNNYGASFSITRASGTTPFNLSGNLNTDTPAVITASNLIAAPVAYHFSQILQANNTGLACREQPNHPGYLEFYATDPTITAFQMSPYNPATGGYPIGSTTANGFAQLGFFSQPVNSTALQNPSFEGPLVPGTPNNSVYQPTTAQWSFSSPTSGIAGQGTWFTTTPPNGNQAAFMQGTGTITQQLQQVQGGLYQLSFFAASAPNYSANPFTVLVDGVQQFTVQATQINGTNWTQFTTSPFSLAAGSHTLSFNFTGGSATATAIDSVQLFTNTLNARQATYPAALTLQGLLDTLNQPNLNTPGGASVTPPAPLPGTNTATGQIYINTATTYTASTLPTVAQFVANTVGNYITPLLFSVTGSGGSATYNLVAAGQPIQATRAGLQTSSLVFTAFTPSATASFVLGFTDQNISGNPATSKSVTPGTVGIDPVSQTGSWSVFPNGTLTPGSTKLAANTSVASNWLVAFSGVGGLAQAGQGSVARPNTDATTNYSYVYKGASYTTAFVPTKIRYYTNLTNSQLSSTPAPSIIPILFTWGWNGINSSANYTVAAMGNPITPTQPGLNEANLLFPNLGSLTPGTNYLFGFRNSSTGVVAVQAGADDWLYTSDTDIGIGASPNFNAAGIYSLDIIASQTAGNPPTGTGTGTSAASTYGQVAINPNTTYTAASNTLVLPTAMQVYATVPASGSGWITPLLFQQNGTGSTATFTLVAAGVSQQIANSGASQLPVAFPTALVSGLPTTGTYVMGYATQQVQLGNGGSIASVTSYSPGMVQYSTGGSASPWLTSAGGSSDSATGCPVLTVGSSVFTQGSTLSTSVLTSGNAYACTFLTDATQYQAYSALHSLQYNPAANNGKALQFSRADINHSAATVNISASGINTVTIPNVTNLNLTGSAVAQAAVSATRQFSLLLDANVFTNGATAANLQQQATATAQTTGVLTSVNTNPGNMPYGVDGFLSSIIQLTPSTQVYATAPQVSITDTAGYALNSSKAFPAWVSIPDLQLGQYAGPSIIGAPTLTSGGSGYTSAPTVTITDSNGGTGSGATATATIAGSIEAIIIASGGTGYTSAPTVTITDSNGSTGSGATAVATIGGSITSINLINGGAGYLTGFPSNVPTPPVVTITDSNGGTGTGATAVATVNSSGVVTAVTITNGGTGYKAPLIWFSNPTSEVGSLELPIATVSTSFSVISITITNPGKGYTNPVITLSGGGGSGATATASLVNGTVTGVTITNGGTAYTAPVATFSGGGGSGASAQFTFQDLLPPASGFTVQGWFNSSNLSSSSGIQTILDLGNGAASDNIILGVNNNQLFMSTYNGATPSTCTGSTTLASNTWYHVSAVFGQGTANLYLNGVLVGSSTSMQFLNNLPRSNNYWGQSNNSANPVWQGQLDELRIWNAPLTANQIQGNWNTPFATAQPNLIAYYKTDKTFAPGGTYAYGFSDADDSSGFGNKGLMTGTNNGLSINNGSVAITKNGTATSYSSGSLTVSAPGVYYLTGTASPASGSKPVPFLVTIDGVPVGSVAASLQGASGYTFVSAGLQLSPGTHTVAFQPQGTAAGSTGLTNLQLNFRPLVQSTAPLPLIGRGATAVANLNPNTGMLSSITVTNLGSGYANPVVTLSGNSAATASAKLGTGSAKGTIQSIKVLSGGQYYSSAPFVTIQDREGATGTGATATAIITNGVVTGITVNNPGSGYTHPVVTLTPPIIALATPELIIPVPAVGVSDLPGGGSGAFASPLLNQNGTLSGIAIANNGATATANLVSGTIGSLNLTNPGQFYTSAPTVTITDSSGGTGSGATATATVVTGMIIAPPAITNPGSGYGVSPTVTITDPTGTGAVAFAILNGITVAGIIIANSGSGYTNPTFTLSPGLYGTATTSYAGMSNYLGGQVTGLTVTSQGSGYTKPMVTITPPATFNGGYVSPAITLPYNAQFAATATATMGSNGTVAGIAINAGGSGYSAPPTVTITGGGGSGATAVATVINGVVTGITVLNPGSGYTSLPTITLGSPNQQATATAVAGRITNISVPAGAGGSGYLSAPAVTIIDPNGFGATATAMITNGVVTGITVTNQGSGYVSPSIVIAPPSAPASASIAGGIGSTTLLSAGSGYTSAPTVTITDAATNLNGPASSAFPLGSSLDTYKGQIYINSQFSYTNTNAPVSFSFYSGNSTNYITPLLFTLSNGTYTLVASSAPVQVQSGLNSNVPLNFNYTLNAGTNYYMGFSDRNGLADTTDYAGSIEWSNASSNPANQWLFTSSGTYSNGIFVYGQTALNSTFKTGSNLSGGTRNYSFNVTSTNTSATASATISGGKVTGITISSQGTGYSSPVITISGGGGSGASASALLALSGTSVTNLVGGYGYTVAPTVLVQDTSGGTGGGLTATATINSSGVVTGITLSGSATAFSSYTAPVLVIALPTGTTATATATATVNSTVSAINLTAGGSGYTSAPTVTITDSNGGTGSGATAIATVVNNVVTGIIITNPGSGYTNPVATLLPPNGSTATAQAAQFSIQLTAPGQYYSQVPAITISGGGGSGATAMATLQNGIVTGITLTSAGTGYTSAPTISITNPVSATAVLTTGVMDGDLTYAGQQYLTNPTVTITDASGNGTGATGYAVLVGGQVSDIVITNYGSGYANPVITIAPPTVNISQVPAGPSSINHTFYFLDGSSWNTTTTSNSGISIQYQLIEQLTLLANAAANGLNGGNGSSAANYYNLQAYLTPLLSETSPTFAQTANLGMVMADSADSPILWYMSAANPGDPFLTQALFANNQWNVATLGAVSMGNIDLVMNLAGNSGSPGFTGTAQIGYLDVNLQAEDFSPDIDFTLDTTPGQFFNFGTWQGILSTNGGLAQYATTTATINSYDLTLSAQVSANVAALLGLPTSGSVMPEVTFTASGGAGVYTGSFSDANWGPAEGLLYISQANIGAAFEQIAQALAYTDTSSYLGANLPFLGGNLQDLTGFSNYFVNYLQDELVGGAPTDLDSLIDWVNDNSSTFTLAFGTLTVAGSTGQGLYLTPVNWADSVSVTTPISFNVGTFAALAGGLPASQSMLAYTVVPPNNTGDLTVTADVAWQAPFGVFFSQTGSGTSLGYGTQGYFSGSAATNAWNLSGISVQGNDLDFQGTLGTLPIFFESDTSDTANVAVTNGQILTTLGATATASAVVTSTLAGSIVSGGYSANLPVYYPTSTCYSGNFNISGPSGEGSTATLVTFLNQAALFNATLSGGIITGFTAITAGSNYLTTSAGGSPPQVLITDAAGQGTGATATATVSSNGTISLTLTSAGSGYISPVVSVVGGTFNFNNPTGTPSVTFTLPDIDNNDIAALSLANAIGNPDNMQSGLGALQAALQSVFTQSMAYTSQIIIGTGTSQFSQAFGIYGQIAGYLDQNLTPFVPVCDQNATASATINSSGAITSITVVTTGESYQSTPAVSITDLSGTGSGATATANMVSDGNGGLKVASITINSSGSGYLQPIVSIGSPSAGNQSADEQLYNQACTAFNLLLATPGLVLDPTQPQNPGTYIPNGQTASTSGQIPLFFDAYGNPLTYNSVAQYFINASGEETTVQAVQFPLIVDFTLQNTTIPFSLGMPGIPLTINNPADLNLVASGSAIVDLTFGIDVLNGFYIVPTSGNQISGTMDAGPDSDFSTTMTLGFLSGTMDAGTGEIFSMPFTSTLTDPNFNPSNLNNELTLAEINNLTPSSLFQTILNIPTVGLNIDMSLQVAGGGIAAALPSIGNTMSITWTPGQGAPQLSYNNFYIDLGSFISDYMGAIAPQLTPITNGIQPILNALDTQIPILGDIIGGDTSLLGLANRFGGANLGFVQAVDAIVDMLGDVTSAVNYINANPGTSFIVPLDVVATFANDFRTAASGLSKPQQLNQLPSQAQVVSAMNNFMSKYANQAEANFTAPASRVVNQSYGVSGGLGISFDILDPVNIIGLITGQTVDIFHIDFPSLYANFSIDESFPLDPPLYMTFGGGVNAGINLSLGMDSAGLEQWLAATVNGTQGLSVAALEGLAQDILYQGFFVDGAGTDISANGYLSLGVQLNAGIAKAGVNGNFNIGMNMTPNVDSSGRLDLQEMIQLAGANFSSPQNLFDFDLTGSISANAYLDIFLPFEWRQVWNHNFGSITLFNVQNNPAPPTEQAASYGSLYLNTGPTAGRRTLTGKVTDEHFEIRHLAGVAGDESLSVQFYVAGVPQYLDAQGNPKPQVYHHVDKVVGIAGSGDDIIDCTGVLSPTHLEGGDGSDTLIGGQGLNYLDGGNGPDTLIGGPLADTILGGAGSDTINGGGGKDSLDGGTGNDTIDHPAGGLVIPFSDRFGGDLLTQAAIAGSTLDFSGVTQNLKVTLGSVSTIQIGNNNTISWSGTGPAKIILGKGSDTVTFASGYSPLILDTGLGNDRVEITTFTPGATVVLNGVAAGQTDQFLVQGAPGGTISVDSSGLRANDATFAVDWTEFRKLNIHQTASEVQVAFSTTAPQKVLVFGSEIDLTGTLNTGNVRLEAAKLVSVQGNITTQPGGEIALVAGPNGKVQIGTKGNALLTATNGNIDLESPVAYLGGIATNQAMSVTNGTFSNEAGKTIVTAVAPTPFFNTAEPAITVGQGGTLRAWSTGGTPLTPELVPFQGYQGVPRFNTDSDLDGDGIADLVSVPQPGVAPHMVVFSGKDMSILRSVYVFDPRFLGGVNVTTGDVDANGVADIILAADAGATPHVVVISGGTWEVMASFYAFDRSFKGGLRLATADADGDGVLDIITSTASGPISHVVAFGNLGQSVISSFYAFPEAVKNGVEIAAADLNNDNIAELILGTSGGTSQQVGVYRGNPNAIDYFMAYENWNGDVRVGSVKTAGKTIITTGPGPGAPPNVRTFDPDSYHLVDSFFAGDEYDLSGVTL